MGAGDVSRRFAASLARVGGQLVAVGSHSAEHAQWYAKEVGARRAHGSYEDVAVDPDVEFVYVGNNHVDHTAAAHIAVAAGKHVLVEKPLGTSRTDAAGLFDAAEDAGVFVMEAMWVRFLPVWQRVLALLADDTIGTVHTVTASLGKVVDASRRERTRLFDPQRAGGALLDMGIYPISIAHMLLGPAEEIEATATLRDGVDAHTEVTTRTDTATAHLSTALDRDLSRTVVVEGDRGRIDVPGNLDPDGFSLQVGDREPRWVPSPTPSRGFQHEIEAVHEATDNGLGEHSDWRHADTLATHGVLDEVRRQIGLVYPFEDGPPATQD